MNHEFYKRIFNRQKNKEAVPTNAAIAEWASDLISLLFPEFSCSSFDSVGKVEEEFIRLQNVLIKILDATKVCSSCNHEQVAKSFFNELPELHRILNTDVESILNGDPAARNQFEVIRAYPGFYA